MKKYLIFFLIITSMVLPILPAIAAPLDPDGEDERLRYATMTAAADWDPAISAGYFVISTQYVPNCLETLTQADGNWDRDMKAVGAGLLPENTRWKTWHPVLATNWTVEYWPEEKNSLGFKNRGGVIGIPLLFGFAFTFLQGLPFIGLFHPLGMFFPTVENPLFVAVILGDVVESWIPLLSTVIVSILFVIITFYKFNREEF